MKLNFEQELCDLEGVPIIDRERQEDGKTKEKGVLTLKSVSLNALLGVYDDERNLSGEDKAKRFKLAMFISDGGSELESEQVTILKKLIGKAYAPIVVGRAYELIENIGPVDKSKPNGKHVGPVANPAPSN